MKAPGVWKGLLALLVGCTVSLSFAKLPAPPPVDPAKAAEVKAKAADAATKSAEALAKAQDRAVERYRKEKGLPVAAAPAKSAAAAKPVAPAKAVVPAAPPSAKK